MMEYFDANPCKEMQEQERFVTDDFPIGPD